MSLDAWSSESFEQKVTAATVALYETKIDPASDQHSINRFSAERLMRMRNHGIYITAPDREVLHPDCGMSILKWPMSGCMALGSSYKKPNDGQADDLLESYCRLVYFKRLNRLPPHSSMIAVGDPYEVVLAWPQNNGPVIGFSEYLTVNRRTGKVHATVPSWNCKDPGKVAGKVNDEEHHKVLFTLGFVMQFIEDARHIWSITAHNEVSKVTVGAHAESVKSLLYARDLPITKTGRKRPILHVVHAHRRRLAAGTDIDVSNFLRGTREIVMNDTKYTVSAPQVMIEQMKSERNAR